MSAELRGTEDVIKSPPLKKRKPNDDEDNVYEHFGGGNLLEGRKWAFFPFYSQNPQRMTTCLTTLEEILNLLDRILLFWKRHGFEMKEEYRTVYSDFLLLKPFFS